MSDKSNVNTDLGEGERIDDNRPPMGRRNLLKLVSAGALGFGTTGTAAADDGEERPVKTYDGDGSISSPTELGKAIMTDGMWTTVTDVEFAGDYGHAEVFDDDHSLLGYPMNGSTYGVISK